MSLQSTYALAAFEAIENAVIEETAIPDHKAHRQLYDFLVLQRASKRLYYLGVNMAQMELWDALRRNEVLLDMVMRVTIAFQVRLGQANTVKWAQEMALAISGLTSVRSVVTDQTFSEKITDKVQLEKILIDETWLLALITLDQRLSRVLPLLQASASRGAAA